MARPGEPGRENPGHQALSRLLAASSVFSVSAASSGPAGAAAVVHDGVHFGAGVEFELAQALAAEELTREEAARFLVVTREHFPRWYPFCLCALRTGLRLGELLGLEWGDLDFTGRFLMVRRNLAHRGDPGPQSRYTNTGMSA